MSKILREHSDQDKEQLWHKGWFWFALVLIVQIIVLCIVLLRQYILFV